MRRTPNALQASHALYDLAGETEVYDCTGKPHPFDIETFVKMGTTAYNGERECGDHRDQLKRPR